MVKILNFELFNQICSGSQKMYKFEILSYLMKFFLNKNMPSLGCQKVKILNFELFNQIYSQLGYATDEPWS